MKRYTPFLLLALVCGCTSTTTTLTKADLNAKAMEQARAASPDSTYYVGSDNRYDYFVIRSGVGDRSRLYRVAEAEDAVTNRFVVTKDEAEWRDYLIDDDAPHGDPAPAQK